MSFVRSVLLFLLYSIAAAALSAPSNMMKPTRHVVKISQPVWRKAVEQHVHEIQTCLQPGLTSQDHVMNTGRRRSSKSLTPPEHNWCTALDPKNPVYNFLIEYYGLKGAKGPKRLARWSPNPALVFSEQQRITELDQLHVNLETTLSSVATNDERYTGGILLEGATENDIGGVLHLRGAIPHDDGIMYSPANFFSSATDDSVCAANPYLWYKSVLQQTLQSEPILHCHGLHEWAMQYQPEGAPPPPSEKYQSHLKLRVSRDTINTAVERRGISCTHVDALRYFAPAAGPLNHHGASLQRVDQLRLEQKGCGEKLNRVVS